MVGREEGLDRGQRRGKCEGQGSEGPWEWTLSSPQALGGASGGPGRVSGCSQDHGRNNLLGGGGRH